MSDGRQVAAVEFDSDTIRVSPSTTGGTTLMILFLLKRITSVPGSWLATGDSDDRTVASRPRELGTALPVKNKRSVESRNRAFRRLGRSSSFRLIWTENRE